VIAATNAADLASYLQVNQPAPAYLLSAGLSICISWHKNKKADSTTIVSGQKAC